MQRATLIASIMCRLLATLTIIGLLGAQTASYHLAGRVMIGVSKPAARVWVILDNGRNQQVRALTGDNGRYYITGLLRQTYTVVVRRELNSAPLFNSQISIPTNGDYNIQIK